MSATPATTPADGELLQRIAENDPSWVLKYLEQNTRFDVPRIRELFEFAKAQAVAALATPSPGKAPSELPLIEQLQDLCAKYGCPPGLNRVKWLDHQLGKLASPGKADAEDAARYRRIRNGPHSDRHGDVYAMVFMPDGDEPIHGAKLDSIIDAAMERDK